MATMTETETAWDRLRLDDPGLADDLVARVGRGAVLLDRKIPGWRGRVEADRLAMETCDHCVLGQVCGSYNGGCRSLIRTLPSTFLFSAADHGFTLFDYEQPPTRDGWEGSEVQARFAALADLWRREVRASKGTK